MPRGGTLLLCTRKEVIQPHVPVRLPCDDLAPLAEPQLDLLIASLDGVPLGWLDGQCVQGAGTYSANDVDVRLLGIPASRGRVSALDPNWARF